jgi:hypothetical protein
MRGPYQWYGSDETNTTIEAGTLVCKCRIKVMWLSQKRSSCLLQEPLRKRRVLRFSCGNRRCVYWLPLCAFP